MLLLSHNTVCVTNSQVTSMNVIIAASTMAWSLEITQLYQIDPQKVDHQKFSYQYYMIKGDEREVCDQLRQITFKLFWLFKDLSD